MIKKFFAICEQCNALYQLPEKTLTDHYPFCSDKCSKKAIENESALGELWRLHRITFRLLLQALNESENMVLAESISVGLAIENRLVAHVIDKKINQLNSELEFFKFSIKKI